eukprot:m.78415 g.78415  ORF g.78415 m.78415 type:complete len:270 (-) comp12668_c0_seq5:1292-2101(-)
MSKRDLEFRKRAEKNIALGASATAAAAKGGDVFESVPKIQLADESAIAASATYAHTPGSNKPKSAIYMHAAIEFMKRQQGSVDIDGLLKEIKANEMNLENVRLFVRDLEKHSKLEFNLENGTISYLPVYNIKHKEHLITTVKNFYENGFGGFGRKDLKESYIGIDKDVQELIDNGTFLEIKKPEIRGTQSDSVIFWREKEYDQEVEKAFKDEWFKLTNTSVNIESFLKSHGKPLFKKPKPKDLGKKRKRAKTNSKRPKKIANAHMLGDG